MTIFPIPRWLQPANPRIDERCHFIGATIDPDLREKDLDAELAAHVDGPEPLVMVSLGTLHAGSDAFFRTCFGVLADLPARILLVVGSHADPARLGPPPANTLVRASVPQLEVLRRAAVFVTHGGMNSALEGLANGVPLVVIPQQFEQLIIGNAVADRGAATVLRHNLSNRPVPPAELRAAVERALTDPSRRTSAKAVADSVGEGGGAPAGAEVIQNLLAGKGRAPRGEGRANASKVALLPRSVSKATLLTHIAAWPAGLRGPPYSTTGRRVSRTTGSR